jgi:hypothetical protein
MICANFLDYFKWSAIVVQWSKSITIFLEYEAQNMPDKPLPNYQNDPDFARFDDPNSLDYKARIEEAERLRNEEDARLLQKQQAQQSADPSKLRGKLVYPHPLDTTALPPALQILSPYPFPKGMRACWFLILIANAKASVKHKLTDEEMAQTIDLLFPPEKHPSRYLRIASRWRKLYHQSDVADRLIAFNRMKEPSEHPLYPPPILLSRYIKQSHYIARIFSLQKIKPAFPDPVPVIYTANESSKPIKQIHPNPKVFSVVYPSRYRRKDGTCKFTVENPRRFHGTPEAQKAYRIRSATTRRTYPATVQHRYAEDLKTLERRRRFDNAPTLPPLSSPRPDGPKMPPNLSPAERDKFLREQ